MQQRLLFIEQNPIDIRVIRVTGANLNSRQAAAAKEGLCPDAFNAIGNRDTRQAGAFPEGTFPDASDAIRDRDTRQAPEASEGQIPDAGDRFSFNFGGDNQIS